MKISEEIVKSLVKNVCAGLSNKDAAKAESISEMTFYDWLRTAEAIRESGKKRLTARDKLCVQLADRLEAARLQRKKRFLEKLEDNKSPAGIIFLLKQAYPDEFNKEPVPLPNFQKLEEFMASEYTQPEIEAIRKAIHTAEARRQSEIRYDENEQFGGTDDAEN